MRILEKPYDVFAPPEGRVTVDLLDERGLKIVHRVRGENTIMNHWLENVKRMVRGDETFVQTAPEGAYSFTGSGVALGTTTDASVAEGATNLSWWTAGVQRGLPLWGYQSFNVLQQSYRNLILSDSVEAVDADEFFFPGNINAFCYMPEAYAPSTNTKRAQLVTALSQRTPTLLRLVAEWGTAYGNGLHNSVGVGHVTFPATQGYAYAMPSLYAMFHTYPPQDTSIPSGQGGPWRWAAVSWLNFFGVNSPNLGIEGPTMSGHWVSNSEIWVLISGTASNNLCKMDLSACTVRPFSTNTVAAGLSVTGPTMTTIGASANRCGVTAIGSDLWLAYGTTLKRCAKPTNTTLSVTNTYTPGGIEACIDITTDGTDLYWLGATTVYKINATTGAITTSWAHGLTGTMYNICYFARPTSKPRLYISYNATALTAATWNVSVGGAVARQPVLADSFTVAGVREPGVAFCPNMNSNINTFFASGLLFPMSTDCKHSFGWWANAQQGNTTSSSVLGPSHMSRTVLGSPVTKTSANSMRVTYDFGF